MTSSYTVGEAVAKYPKRILRRDIGIFADLEGLDDFAPRLNLQERAKRLSTGQLPIKKARDGIYEHEGILKSDLANYIILGTAQILKEIGEEGTPVLIPPSSPKVMDRSYGNKSRQAITLSLKEIELPDHNRLRFVREELTRPNSLINEHFTAWYLEVVGSEGHLVDQTLLAGYRAVHGG